MIEELGEKSEARSERRAIVCRVPSVHWTAGGTHRIGQRLAGRLTRIESRKQAAEAAFGG